MIMMMTFVKRHSSNFVCVCMIIFLIIQSIARFLCDSWTLYSELRRWERRISDRCSLCRWLLMGCGILRTETANDIHQLRHSDIVRPNWWRCWRRSNWQHRPQSPARFPWIFNAFCRRRRRGGGDIDPAGDRPMETQITAASSYGDNSTAHASWSATRM